MRLNGARQTPAPCERIDGLEHLDKVIDIDQSPIGRTPRSNPATYTGAFGPIRDWYAGLPESKARGYKSGRFSFNVKGGRCEACQGDGVIKRSRCTSCPTSTSPARPAAASATTARRWKSCSRARASPTFWDMTVEDAEGFFSAVPAIREKMTTLMRVGLGYIKVGPAGNDAVGRRGAAGEALEGAGAALDRADALHPRRADDGAALRGYKEAARGAARAGGAGQFGGGDRAQPRRHQDRRPHRRHRPRGRATAAAPSSPPAHPKRSRGSRRVTPASTWPRCWRRGAWRRNKGRHTAHGRRDSTSIKKSLT